MPWNEIDWDDRVWTLPAIRMKAGKEHRVPLSDRAIELLRRQREHSTGKDYVFTGYRANSRLTANAMRRMLSRMGVSVTVHGFRASFRTWAGNMQDFDWDVKEICLAHKVGNRTTGAYWRGDALAKRRPLMEAWANYCAGACIP